MQTPVSPMQASHGVVITDAGVILSARAAQRYCIAVSLVAWRLEVNLLHDEREIGMDGTERKWRGNKSNHQCSEYSTPHFLQVWLLQATSSSSWGNSADALPFALLCTVKPSGLEGLLATACLRPPIYRASSLTAWTDIS